MTAVDECRDRRSGPEGPVAVGSAARTAVRDTAPFALALVPFGLALGVAARSAGLSALEALLGAVALLAGAAQLAVVDSIGRGDGIVLAVTAAVLVNLRFVLYGAGVAEWFADSSRLRRLLLVFPVVDQTFLLCQQRFGADHDQAWRQRYYLTVTALLGGTFVGCQAVALHVGQVLPAGAGLHLAAPLAFAGLLARSLAGRRELTVAIVGAGSLVAAAPLLGPAALPVAVAVAVAVGTRTWRSS